MVAWVGHCLEWSLRLAPGVVIKVASQSGHYGWLKLPGVVTMVAWSGH